MYKIITFSLCSIVLLGAGCTSTQEQISDTTTDDTTNVMTDETETMTYDQDSWKELISDQCMSYFDGCNNCRRSEPGSNIAACTKKFCATYEKPVCLDE